MQETLEIIAILGTLASLVVSMGGALVWALKQQARANEKMIGVLNESHAAQVQMVCSSLESSAKADREAHWNMHRELLSELRGHCEREERNHRDVLALLSNSVPNGDGCHVGVVAAAMVAVRQL